MEKLQKHTIDKNEIVISIKGLYKSFDDLDVLKGVDLNIFKGENVAVLGKSGSGKSVLIKIIVGLLKPDRGEVFALGKHVNQLNQKELDELRLKIGFSFQSSALYDGMNVYQNLAFPLNMNKKNLSKKEVDFEVESVLDSVGLLEKLEHMPSELSGGQRKRVGIARTLILKPEIMLYDEPTAGLDPITSTEIIDLINGVQHKYQTSSIIITHDLTCAKNTSDRAAMLFDGQFVKVGTFDEVFESDNQYLKDFYNYNFIE
jgi:phospholipid/cholesterol/gamma-HCH transport system ATP-binding protein